MGCVESAGGEDGDRVWVSVRDRPLVHLFNLTTSSLITSVDCSLKLHDVLRGQYSLSFDQYTLSISLS